MEEYTLDDSPPEMAPIDLTKSARTPVTSTVVLGDISPSPSTSEQTLDTYVQKELGELPVGTLLDTPAEINAERRPPLEEMPTTSPDKPLGEPIVEQFSCGNKYV